MVAPEIVIAKRCHAFTNGENTRTGCIERNRVYLGAIHNMATLKERVDTARKFLPDFGLAAYCGFGRTPVEKIPGILQDHLAALKIAGVA